MSVTSLSFTFVNLYAPQGAKPVAATPREAPAPSTPAKDCEASHPAVRQNGLVQAMMSALRELGVGSPTAPAAPAATSAGSVVSTDAAAGTSAVPPGAEPAAAVTSAVYQFAHELFQALRHSRGSDASNDASGGSEREGGHGRVRGHTARGGHGYGNLSQRLEALARTFVAPTPTAVAVDAPAQAAPSTAPLPTAGVVAGPDAPNATAAPAADGQGNPLLAAFSKLFNALQPQGAATSSETDMAGKLRTFLQTLAQAIRPEPTTSTQAPQVGGLVYVTA